VVERELIVEFFLVFELRRLAIRERETTTGSRRPSPRGVG
jgi:hypothetical protein